MSCRNLVLPPEILHAILSRAIARHLDDVLAASSSSPASPSHEDPDAQIGALVTALLAVSCQVRQTALLILSSAFGIALSRVGLWRLEDRPWPKIESVRRILHRKFDFGADRDLLIRLMTRSACPEPPILAVYLYAHVLNEISAHHFEPMVLPVQGGGEPLAVDSESTAHYFEVHTMNQYAASPTAFRELLWARLEHAFAAGTIARTYGKVMLSINTTWERIEDFASSIDAETPPSSVSTLTKIICDLVAVLHTMRAHEEHFMGSWPHTVPADVAIGAERLAEWFDLFYAMVEWDYAGESADDLREAALDFADDFHARLMDLCHAGGANQEELSEGAGETETESQSVLPESCPP
ncbi:hypothetical protein PsYK624_118340 [Phanerochaete sordida]|uniref:Uncharacterized protein n=1 Tax=Phanerochaete sordida TaxID=48140 RepID=A0A9P3GIP4_9APHY|nr:hypothetical protein PsYK624_118340 [Phanerochaete sordida]